MSKLSKKSLALREKKKEVLDFIVNNPAWPLSSIAKKYDISVATVRAWEKNNKNLYYETCQLPTFQKPIDLTWQQILDKVPDTATLGYILVEGFLKYTREKDLRILELETKLKNTNKTKGEQVPEDNILEVIKKSFSK